MPDPARLPNFLFIGSAKCGSTWLYRALRAHPQIFVPPAKDIYYFDRYYNKGSKWYASFFKPAPANAMAVGELSHDYLYSTKAAGRIAKDLAGVKLLAAVRNPIERAYSAYLFQKRNGTAGRDFDETVERSPNIVQRGRYADALEVYFDLFGRDRVKVMLFDDLKADAQALTRDVYTFLGVDASFEYVDAKKKVMGASTARIGIVGAGTKRLAKAARAMGMANLIGRIKDSPGISRLLYQKLAADQTPPLTESQRQRLQAFYREDIERVGRLLGRDLSHWLENVPVIDPPSENEPRP